jgi:3-oxoacyl-[acyl-carrier protein] reductase
MFGPQFLQGQGVLVTGGARGIGRGIVIELAKLGARVAFTYTTNPTAAEKLLAELPGEGHGIFPLDISSADQVQGVFTKVLEHFSASTGLTGLVNNAGITKDQLILRMKDADFDDVIQTNLRGTYLCFKAALKPMLKARKGSIVNITSVIGHSGNPGQANYAASKAGIEALARSVAAELGSRAIRVNNVAPGFIQTDMTDVLTDEQKNTILQKIPLQKFGDVSDVAAAVAFLLSDRSQYMTGQTLHVNGGMLMG